MTDFSHASFQKYPLIGILRGYNKANTSAIAEAYIAAGLTTLEITLNTPAALEIIESIASRYSGSLNIGAGTVCSINEMENALNAGAGFIVTPVLNTEIIHRCRKINVPVFPGALSPTEIYNAWEAGANMVKVFPANSFGPEYIKQVKAPLDNIKLLPTGGISLDNIAAYRDAGADGFGLGSSLFRDDLIGNGQWAALENHFRKFAALYPGL